MNFQHFGNLNSMNNLKLKNPKRDLLFPLHKKGPIKQRIQSFLLGSKFSISINGELSVEP